MTDEMGFLRIASEVDSQSWDEWLQIESQQEETDSLPFSRGLWAFTSRGLSMVAFGS